MLNLPILSNPILIEPNLARFRAADPMQDVYVKVVLAQDTYYPSVFLYRSVVSFPNMVAIEGLCDLHPALDRLNNLLQARRRGWQTKAFNEILRTLGMTPLSIMPQFRDKYIDCGKELLGLLSAAFEDAQDQQRHILDYLPALQYAGWIAKYLCTADKPDLREAARHVPDITSDDTQFICQVSDCLQRHGIVPAMHD